MRLRLRRTRLLLGALALGAALLAAACSPKNTLVPSLAPETGVFVQGAVDTVNHIVKLYWFGNDPDGRVVGFELRFRNPSAPADTQWSFTTRTDSTFTVFTPAGFTAPRFEVRSVDDAGLRDPTPAFADFSFTNQAPAVTITGAPGPTDSTYATGTIDWTTTDPDGDVNAVRYRIWLDGQDSTIVPLVSGRRYTVPSADFLDGGVFRGGIRTAYLQPIDDGGMVGATVSTSWYVRETSPGARLLIVDDLPGNNPLNASSDQLYVDAVQRATLAGGLPSDSWSVLRLESNKAFRSAEDVRQTFALFGAVIWYRGDQNPTLLSAVDPLRDFQDGIAAYVEGGGNLMLEGRGLFRATDVAGNTTGSLDPSMADRLFDSDGLFEHPPTGATSDSPIVWGINNGRVLRSSAYQDSLRFAASRSGLFGFTARDTNEAIVWARAGVLSQNNPADVPVGMSVQNFGGGRAVILAFPLRVANGFPAAPDGSTSASRTLDRIFQALGLRP